MANLKTNRVELYNRTILLGFLIYLFNSFLMVELAAIIL